MFMVIRSMLKIESNARLKELGFKLLLQIHDEVSLIQTALQWLADWMFRSFWRALRNTGRKLSRSVCS